MLFRILQSTALLVVTTLVASSAMGGPHNSDSFLRPVALVGDADRRTIGDYVSDNPTYQETDISELFRSVGTLRCPWRLSTAVIVEAPDILIFPAHVILGAEGELLGDIDACVFAFKDHFGDEEVRKLVADTVKTGRDRDKVTTLYEYDWAVARLAAATDVKPLTLNSERRNGRGYRQKIVLASAGHDNWPGHGPNEFSIGDCRIMGIGPRRRNGVIQARTDCDVGRKASGSVFGTLTPGLNGDGDFAVTAMVVASSGTDAPRAEFDVDKNYTAAITIEGAFRAAVLSAVYDR